MIVVLAEKPSVARDLAAHLGATTRHEGYLEGQNHQVTWALGHLVTLKEPHDYDPALKKWSLADLPFVPEPFELKTIDEPAARKQFAVVKRLFRSADAIICATDAGREGELIFRYILEHSGCHPRRIERLWLSSLTPQAIRQAFAHLRPASDFDRLGAAARCRSEADWIVGLNATRNYTVRYGGGILWSVGRVQTPVLALIVARDDEIRMFRPEPFWELLTRYRGVVFRYAPKAEGGARKADVAPRGAGQGNGLPAGRFAREAEAQAVLARVEGQPLAIGAIAKRQERIEPPQLYDLTELQRDMNRRFGLSADQTLSAAQSLYERKYLTYPRTDSRYVGNDQKREIPTVLQKLSALRPGEIAALDLAHLRFTGRIVNDAKVTDHHAILPTGQIPSSLAPAAQKVFDAVVTRLIAAFYPPCLKELTTIDAVSAEVPFRARGVRVLDAGWTALEGRREPQEGDDDQQSLPELVTGEQGPHQPEIRKGETRPPAHYTDNTLLGAMETAGRFVDDDELREALKERGLGTPATRAAMIETLLRRGYVARSGRTLQATDLGRYLIALVRDRQLKSPELTGQWEAKLKDVEAGRCDPLEFTREIIAYTRQIILGCTDQPLDPGRWGPCPRCGSEVIQGKRAWGCSGWKRGCGFVLHPAQLGMELSPEQVRELLQRGKLADPVTVEGQPAILALSAGGAVVSIAVPSADHQRGARGGKWGKRPSRKRTAAGTGWGKRPSRKQTGTGTGKKTLRRAGRSGDAPAGDSDAEAEPAGKKSASGPLGVCPQCGGQVVERPKSFSCGGCPLVIWKMVAGKKISARTARTLLSRGRTEVLKGFTSKAGRKFDAALKLEAGNVVFDFGAKE